jgi:MoaA/NifB/PqqE/SkfB family radical SAM enzyme
MTINDTIYYGWRKFKWSLGDRSPLVTSIKLTYRCNLSCIHCGWQNKYCSNEITTNEWFSIFLKLYKQGIRILVFEGGEPTLRQDLIKLINYAKRIGFKILLVTNGSNSLVSYNADLIAVSVDGLKEVHDRIRGNGSFNQLLKNINIVKTKKAALTTINKLNIDNISNIPKMLFKYFDAFAFNIAYPINGAYTDIFLNKEEIKYVYEMIKLLSQKYEIVNTIGMINNPEWECMPWMLTLCEPNGNIPKFKKCFVEQITEKVNCSQCHLACFRAVSQLAQRDNNIWYIYNKLFWDKNIN